MDQKEFAKYQRSYDRFTTWKSRSGKLIGFMLWRIEFAGFFLEAWNDDIGRLIIFQIFQHSGEFKAFTDDQDYLNQLDIKF